MTRNGPLVQAGLIGLALSGGMIFHGFVQGSRETVPARPVAGAISIGSRQGASEIILMHADRRASGPGQTLQGAHFIVLRNGCVQSLVRARQATWWADGHWELRGVKAEYVGSGMHGPALFSDSVPPGSAARLRAVDADGGRAIADGQDG